MYRYRPDYDMKARPVSEYPHRSVQAAAIMLMITNNLDPAVAQHPHELITYGGNGAVFQNWAQYRLTMKYLSGMTDEQTLVMYSGHPLGLFPSHREAPRRWSATSPRSAWREPATAVAKCATGRWPMLLPD